MGFLYSIFLKLLYPTSVAVLLLMLSAALRRRHEHSRPSSGPQLSGFIRLPRRSQTKAGHPASDLRPLTSDLWARLCFWSALAVLLICGNGWVVKYSTRYLERQYPPLADMTADHGPRTTDQVSSQLSVVSGSPIADCILVLGGGTVSQIPPRQAVEVSEAGDRVLYAARLYREGRAPKIVCTSGIATGGIAPRPAADDMAELLESIGVPKSAILKETRSGNTHQHAQCMGTVLQDHGFKRVLLVTSAVHMPRSMGVFKRSCPYTEFIPAPTDFRTVDLELPWYREMVGLIPTPSSYVQFSETMHEYLGMAWYRVRGWM